MLRDKKCAQEGSWRSDAGVVSNRAARKSVMLLVAGLGVLATVCATTVPASSAAYAGATSGKAVSPEVKVNQSLDSLAKLFARAIADDPDLGQQIRDGAARRFDGDTNVLYTSLSKSSDVRRDLATAYSRVRGVAASDSLGAIDRLVAEVPRFQIAVPTKFGTWDPKSYTPLVAYMPDGAEDTELTTVTAYDETGRAHQLDAQREPDQPVIVLGLNERTDDSGALLYSPSPTSTSTSSAAAALATKYEVRMVEVSLFDDNEPWTRGDAEIALRAKSYASSATCGTEFTDYNWPNLNDSDDAWAPTSGPKLLGYTCADVGFAWWEDDGGSSDFALMIGDFNLGVSMDNDDDMIGKARVAHSTFQGASMENVRWNDLSQWTD